MALKPTCGFTLNDLINQIRNATLVKIIGVIGDIHTELGRLRKALDWLNKMALDEVLCVGDIVDGTGDVNACVNLLRQNQVRTVLGNHDAWFLKNSMRDLPDATPVDTVNLKNSQFIRDLPPEIEYDTPAGRMLLCHGLGKNNMAKVRDDDYGYALDNNFELQELMRSGKYRFVVNGHTHYRMVRDFGGLTVINAGTLLYGEPEFLTIDFPNRIVTIYGLAKDVPDKKEEIRL